MAGISTIPDSRIDWNSSQKWHIQLGCGPLPSSMRKDLRPLTAVTADKVTHVFDDTQERNIHLLEHRHALTNVVECDFLRRGHRNRPGQRNHLRQRKLHITGTGWQVDE